MYFTHVFVINHPPKKLSFLSLVHLRITEITYVHFNVYYITNLYSIHLCFCSIIAGKLVIDIVKETVNSIAIKNSLLTCCNITFIKSLGKK